VSPGGFYGGMACAAGRAPITPLAAWLALMALVGIRRRR